MARKWTRAKSARAERELKRAAEGKGFVSRWSEVIAKAPMRDLARRPRPCRHRRPETVESFGIKAALWCPECGALRDYWNAGGRWRRPATPPGKGEGEP